MYNGRGSQTPIPMGPGEALNFGSGGSYLGFIAALRGFNITPVDLQPVHWHYFHPKMRFIQSDILKFHSQKNIST